MCQNLDGKFEIPRDMVFIAFVGFQICTFLGLTQMPQILPRLGIYTD